MSAPFHLDYPFTIDARGRTATCDLNGHVRDMIEQLLFTLPGERVNRPTFGSGLMHAVFATNTPELATALQYTTRAALQRWLGDVIDVLALDFRAEEGTLRVLVHYSVRRTGERHTETFERSLTP
ncbi:MAG: GPW/gp25 family protein [Polyangiales bacterium]